MTVIPSVAGILGPIGTPELLVILFVVLLLFGAKRLPELARSIGKSMHEFKKAATDVEDNFRAAVNEEERKKAAPLPTNSTPPANLSASPSPIASVEKNN